MLDDKPKPIVGQGGWPSSRALVEARKRLELPKPKVIGHRIDKRPDCPGGIGRVTILAMAHEADMLRGNADA